MRSMSWVKEEKELDTTTSIHFALVLRDSTGSATTVHAAITNQAQKASDGEQGTNRLNPSQISDTLRTIKNFMHRRDLDLIAHIAIMN